MSQQSLDVSGGAASIAANCEDLVATSALIGTLADNVGLHALLLQRELLDGANGSTLIDPVGAARFEFALLRALDGPTGLAALAVQGVTIQLAVRAAAEAYLAADRLRVEALPAYEAVMHGVPANITAIEDLAEGRFAAALQDPFTQNPYLVDILAGQLMTKEQLRATGALYPDGHAVLTPSGVDRSAAGTRPPRSAADLMRSLATRSSGEAGEIDVRILTGIDANGAAYRKVIVDIPGTKDWDMPGTDASVANVGTNVRALAGERTSYEDGVIAAMRAAGIRPGDDVTLVGHSLGGVIAVNTARDLAKEGQNVSHVITAGSPISQVVRDLPKSVSVLAIENRGDVVPHVDGSANPDQGNITTATIDHGDHTVGGNHGLDSSYVPGAADIDASDDPSARAYLAGLDEQLNATSVTTYTYVVTRGF